MQLASAPSDFGRTRSVGLEIPSVAPSHTPTVAFRIANLIGKLLPLREACLLTPKESWRSFELAREPQGRPFLVASGTKSPLSYDYNISHDGDVVVMASMTDPGRRRVGIDVMRVGMPMGVPSIPEFEATVADLLSSNEKLALAVVTADQKLELLLRYWTSKEAISKALGKGLAFPFAELDCASLQKDGSCRVGGKFCSTREYSWRAGTASYMIALAVTSHGNASELPDKVEQLSVQVLVADALRLAGGE